MAAPVLKNDEKEALKSEFSAAVLAAVARTGLDGWDKDGVIRLFLTRGPSKATLYRWLDAMMKSGVLGAHLAKTVKARAGGKVKAADRPAKPAKVYPGRDGVSRRKRKIAKLLPPVVTVDEVAAATPAGPGRAGSILARLEYCLATAEQVMAHSKAGDSVRNGRMLLAASEHLRRSIETACRLHEAMNNSAQVERFHAAIVEEIGKLDRATAERIIARLQAIQAEWTP